jgi:hypothetical protein
MITKLALAVAVVLGMASTSFAAPMKSHTSASQPLYFKLATGADWWKI